MDYQRKRFEGGCDKSMPPYSRLFIVCDKKLTEEQFQESFSKFGTIKEIRIPLDHKTREQKGVVYIQFSKTSEAATALEEMNGVIIHDSIRPLKVLVACNRSEIQSSDNDTQKYRRLFVHVPISLNEDSLQCYFGQFGDIEMVTIQRDRSTGESKGFAYVTFRKFTDAARAFEQCEKKYRAIFAAPRASKRTESQFESSINNLAATTNQKTSLISLMNAYPEGYTRVIYLCSPYLTYIAIQRIFDIVPGMLRCQFYIDLVHNYGKGTVTYSNPVSAAYAVQKLDQFEYPPGVKIIVRPDIGTFDSGENYYNDIPNAIQNLKSAIASSTNSATPDLVQLAEAVAEATKLIKMTTASVTDETSVDSNDFNYCSAKLPPPKPLADIDSRVAKRCFLVCKPQPPPLTVLRDIFCRFGDLINVYTLPNKTVGYARYASSEAADQAIKTLHGAEICGIRIKVLEADDEINTKKIKHE